MFFNKNLFNLRNLGFFFLFVAVTLLGYHFNVFQMWGADSAYFTAYQFFGPLPAAFLGPFAGAIAVIIAAGLNFGLMGETITIFSIGRLFTMVLATWYFATYKENKIVPLIPLIGTFLFVINPIGMQAWYYSLFWVIPAVISFALPKNLFLRALGATFCAHAVGSIAFLYSIGGTPEMWISLIPVVAVERVVYALGIGGSFIVFNSVLNHLFGKEQKDSILHIEKEYSYF
ncbi:hypothetical protein JXB01_02950 [Candidatus Micrarchaeota archaeon]|nr:hypothetical protein [Candidatus Micrarchaeota archaeon]